MNKGLKVKHNPQLKQRVLSGGRISLYLEYYLGRSQEPKLDENGHPMFYSSGRMTGKPMYRITHNRKKEELRLYLIAKPRTPEEREQNRVNFKLAENIRSEEERKLLNSTMGYDFASYHKNDNVFSFFERYLAEYEKKDWRNIKLAINRFKTFVREYYPNHATKKSVHEIEAIKEDWKERHKGVYGRHDINDNEFFRFSMKPGQLTEDMVKRFVDYLKKNSEGSGAATAYERFQKIIRYGVEIGLFRTNPCARVSCSRNQELTKDILSEEEIARLVGTHYQGENPEIQRAFIMTLFTGIRFCDVKDLTFNNIDYSNSMLSFEQSKTTGHSKASRVYMPLRSDLLSIIKKPEEMGRSKDDKIFLLPSHTMCLKGLRTWCKKAGIDKHITWHCGRHSFATNILTKGANVAVVAKLLGHSNLKTVAVYVRALDEAKRAAVESLPQITY